MASGGHIGLVAQILRLEVGVVRNSQGGDIVLFFFYSKIATKVSDIYFKGWEDFILIGGT